MDEKDGDFGAMLQSVSAPTENAIILAAVALMIAIAIALAGSF
jgi:hypothetical protein